MTMNDVLFWIIVAAFAMYVLIDVLGVKNETL